MRLLELHLDRFGCFTDRRLSFRPDAALTVIYGANEAGKTTALAGLADVLYGIEMRSSFDFLHRYQDMRLGAAITGEDGRRFEFRRRKGSQNTLLDANETPLPEDALTAFLGSVDRALFLDAFGLNRERLRAGARRLIDGGGRVGETMLAAAPGLSSLIGLRASFAAEADQLFPVGRKVSSRPFWQACERHGEARERVRRETLRVERVRDAHADREKAAQAVAVLRQEQRKARTELSRLVRLKHALPCLGRIDDLLAERAGLGELPQVAADFPARCRAALDAQRALAVESQRIEQEIAAAKVRLEALSVDDALLGQADAVDRLADQRAAIVKATEDLPKREGELAALRRQADEHARRLGLADRDALLARRPPDAAVARARSLLAQRRRMGDQRDERRDSLASVIDELEALARRREGLGHVADPAPLRRQLDGLAGVPERVAACADLAANLAARQADLDDRLQRLVVPVASADELARLAVPDLAAIDQAIERFDQLEKQRSELASERRKLDSQRVRVERRIGELVADGEMPTAEALGAARRTREDLWNSLRPRLLGEPLPADPLGDVEAYEDAVGRADRLADRRQAEADRLADFRKLHSEQRELADDLAAAGQALGALEGQVKQAQTDWTALWSPSQLMPKTPREMRSWLQAAADILRLRGELGADRTRFAEADGKLGEMTERLRKLAHSLGIEGPADPPAELLQATAAAVSAMETTFHDARLIKLDRDRCEKSKGGLEAALGELERQEADWRRQWCGAAGAIELREAAVDEEAEACLNIWQAVPALEASLKEMEHRVERMQQDWEGFEHAAGLLCGAIAGDLAAMAPLPASAALKERLVKARQAATQREDLGHTLATLADKAGESRRHEQLNETELTRLCNSAGIDDWDALGALASRIERDLSLAGEIAKERKALLDAADGFSEAELRAELASLDPDSLSARLRELEDVEVALEGRLSEAIGIETLAVKDLADIEAQAGAAVAAQDEQNALAEVAAIIDAWTGAAAAERLLIAAIEAYRAQHQNPLLDRVSQAFAIATGNAFSGIALDYDDSDAHRIVALRPDGSRLAVEALSEGTADQLFLALRIATIEDHARRAQALPFVADDLFVTFDDTRTKAGLTLLAELGRTTQTIVFTHHQHVVEAARHLLGQQLETIDLG